MMRIEVSDALARRNRAVWEAEVERSELELSGVPEASDEDWARASRTLRA